MYEQRWVSTIESDLSAITDAIGSWCRQTIGNCRRPYGIDQFDLNLTFVVDATGGRQATFKGLRPQRLYEPTFEADLQAIAARAGAAPGCSLHVSAELFSWGDAADRALPRSQAFTRP